MSKSDNAQASGNQADNLSELLKVGDVGLYRTVDGGYGVSVDFYDNSYYLAHPADTIEGAIKEMCNEWRIQAALQSPEYLEIAYRKKLDELNDLQPSDSDTKSE